MSRALVLCLRPRSVSEDEGVAWAREQIAHLAAVDSIQALRLSGLESADESHPRTYDWLLELELRSLDALGHRAFLEFVFDLRMLGLKPTVLVPRESHLASAG